MLQNASLAESFSVTMDALLGTHEACLGVAVSGGADSMACTLLAQTYTNARNIPLFTTTIDHGLRTESAAEAAQVQKWCSAHSIIHETLQWVHEKPLTGNLQEQARNARYQWLEAWAQKHSITHILLAHHADDQAETLLWNLVRGSGVDGLSAMPATRQGNGVIWLRPLLGATKQQLEDYCTQQGQAWIEDPSNQNTAFTRVWLRQWLQTFVEKFSSQGFSSRRLERVAENMARARDALEFYTQRFWDEQVHITPEQLSFAFSAWQAIPEEIQLRALARAQQTLCPSYDRPRMDSLIHLKAHLDSPNGHKRIALGGCFWQISAQAQIFVQKEPSNLL